MELISTTDPTIVVKQAGCIPLELKLNVSSKGHEWKHIGDLLYDYGRGTDGAYNFIQVTHEQYVFLKILLAKPTWQECRDL